MELKNLFTDKSTKPKEKTEAIAKSLLENKIKIDELVDFAVSQKDPVKATCIEAIEMATQTKPGLVNENTLKFIISSLSDKAPRIKWESARVIANTAHLFSEKHSSVIKELLKNTNHEGTVVRWCTALAFSHILKTNSPESKKIIPGLKTIADKEEKNSIKKIYLAALKGK